MASRSASTSSEAGAGTAPQSTTTWPSLGRCWIKVTEDTCPFEDVRWLFVVVVLLLLLLLLS